MGIRWRFVVLAIQIVILLSVTAFITGKPFTDDVWFFAGLLAVVINPQLLEPYYPSPGDVVGNSVIFLFIYSVTEPVTTSLGWDIAAVTIGVFGLLAFVGVFTTASPHSPSKFNLGRAARSISAIASAQAIYSVVFFLSLLDYRPSLGQDFWILSASWMGLILIGRVNWQRIWIASSAGNPQCNVESLIGPSIITVTAQNLPRQDTWVEISSKSGTSTGIVLKRILRKEDIWAQIHVTDPRICEKFLADGQVGISSSEEEAGIVVGSADAGSSDSSLSFVTTRPLEIGQVVAVPQANIGTNILYQLNSAVIEHTDVKGGAHLFERARAAQLGIFVPEEYRFRRHLWVPAPGSPIVTKIDNLNAEDIQTPEGSGIVGSVIGTNLPVYLDLDAASTGHVAILGMTKMGKSTLAERLATQLSKTRRVTILDLTGEYVGKKGFPKCNKEIDWSSNGVSVFEPKPGEVPAARAEEFLNFLLEKAQEEYKDGDPYPRTIIIDEAHQFIPEPAGLGFNAPGRDNSFKIGLLLMQIRKFGISVILISQRTAVVAKSALSQCENLIAFRSVDQTGLDYLEALAGEDIRPMLPRLKQGEALVFGPAISSDMPVAVNVFMANPN